MESIAEIAKKIKLVITDVDGVLTDTGVYYSERGEEMKRFSIRDGMGVERLRNVGVETAIITGEGSPSVLKRAEKLHINELHLRVKNKIELLGQICEKHNITPLEIAYIGDDVNDVEMMQAVGLAASPADGMSFAKDAAHFICSARGGHGAFREFAELIIAAQ